MGWARPSMIWARVAGVPRPLSSMASRNSSSSTSSARLICPNFSPRHERRAFLSIPETEIGDAFRQRPRPAFSLRASGPFAHQSPSDGLRSFSKRLSVSSTPCRATRHRPAAQGEEHSVLYQAACTGPLRNRPRITFPNSRPSLREGTCLRGAKADNYSRRPP